MGRFGSCLLKTLLPLLLAWLVLVSADPLGGERAYLVVLDASGSMEWPFSGGGGRKMDAAKEAVRLASSALGRGDEMGLMVFYTCGDVRLEAPVGSAPEEISEALEPVEPVGATPIAESIRRAWEEMRGVRKEPHIVLVTDGGETCGGLPIEEGFAVWRESGGRLRIDVIAVDISPAFNATILPILGGVPNQIRLDYERLARETGGFYVEVSDREGIIEAMKRITGRREREVYYLVLPSLVPVALLVCLGLRAREADDP
ncbi:MAG: hypothetical protein DRO06_04425 [Thermoproteota archaeon]|nr:MAG: hypothetical protein DRO06_04425 [Candidatus Korarchaeota archaeon]